MKRIIPLIASILLTGCVSHSKPSTLGVYCNSVCTEQYYCGSPLSKEVCAFQCMNEAGGTKDTRILPGFMECTNWCIKYSPCPYTLDCITNRCGWDGALFY
jgi:hypothetical protein